MNADELRYKMKHLGALCPNRSVANDDEFYELYSKFKLIIDNDLEIFCMHCYILHQKFPY